MPRRPWARRLALFAAGAVLIASNLAAAADDAAAFAEWRKGIKLPVVRVKTVAEAPKIDGQIDDVYLKNAEPLDYRYSDGFGGPIEEPTRAYIVSDKENLYVVVHCTSKNPNRLVTSATERDKDVWKDEAAEVFLDPQNVRQLKKYFHIMVNSTGVTQDAQNQKDNSWNPELTVKCTKDKTSWTMEIAIPFRELDIQPGQMNKVWSINLTRSARDPDDPWMGEDTAWSPTKARTSHIPERFGYMWLDAGNRINE